MEEITEKNRCKWLNNDPLYIRYHDEEWGNPITNDKKWFEFILLEAFQAGLSWYIVLKKRENFRKAFDDFEPEIIAHYNEDKIESLINDAGIIRNKLKINAMKTNAQAFLKIQQEFGSFNTYIWQFTEGKTIYNNWESLKEIPAKTLISDKMSKDLLKRGFKFVGSTICYALMQASGMVHDHTVDCFLHKKTLL